MERGIIFTGESVRAILDEGKTQTRRVVKPMPEFIGGAGEESDPACWGFGDEDGVWHVLARGHNGVATNSLRSLRCPYGVPGDRLWVREAFRLRRDMDDRPPSQDWWKAGAWYEATDTEEPSGCMGGKGKLRSPWFMPRWASRILLEVVGVRVERLQNLSEEDAIAEGIVEDRFDPADPIVGPGPIYRDPLGSGGYSGGWSATHQFSRLWDSINWQRPGCAWTDDPWCWALTFKLLEPEPELAQAAA